MSLSDPTERNDGLGRLPFAAILLVVGAVNVFFQNVEEPRD